MKAIRLESFRSLTDTGFVSLRPLTVLVGRNSSGKSSFLRFLPLLRQSVEARTTGPIQWYGDYVDFGGFDETVSSQSNEKEIRFGFQLHLDPDLISRHRAPSFSAYRKPKRRSASASMPCKLTLAIVPDPKDNSVTRFRSVALEVAGHSILVGMKGPTGLGHIVVNGKEPLASAQGELVVRRGRLLPLIHRRRTAAKAVEAEIGYRSPVQSRILAYEELKKALRPLFHAEASGEQIFQATRAVSFGESEDILASLQAQGKRGMNEKLVKQVSLGSERFVQIRDLVVANHLAGILQVLDRELWAFAAGVRYIKPVRATAERYYRQQDLAVDEVDPEGRNLAVFLRSLTKLEQRDFERWTEEELGWKIVTRLRGGHISLRIQQGDAEEYNLTDVGFGFSQVLPVIAQLWSMQRNLVRHRYSHKDELTFAIEQPELHLHPALQARLADVLARAIGSATRKGIKLTVVVETHSEAIVNRIGHQIASGSMASGHAAVVLFNPGPVGGESDVQVASFRPDGTLQHWPFGFFEPV